MIQINKLKGLNTFKKNSLRITQYKSKILNSP